MRTALGLLLASTLPGVGVAQTAPGESLPVVEHTLDNGMRLLILERHESPTVSFVVHYPVGSVDERLGNTGIAHVLEHMLFKGTEEIGTTDWEAEAALLDRIDAVRDSALSLEPEADPSEWARLDGLLRALEDTAATLVVPNEFDRILSRAGARGLNATTTHEATQYYVEMPANRTELWFAMEAERLKRPVFREFYSELDVVMEERRLRLETSPGAMLQIGLLATAFQVHPYGVPVVGHASDLESLTRDQAGDYFRRFYGAGNATVAIVGDVDTGQIIQWAEEYFGDLPSGEAPPTRRVEEPPQRGERRITVEYDAEPQVAMAWRGVSGHHPDAAALSVLAVALTGGRTSRLHRRLVTEERSAIRVYAYQAPGFRDPRLFWISAVPRAPHGTDAVEAAILEEVERIKREPPSPEVLTRIRNQIRAGAYRRLERNFELAGQLAESEAVLGDWRATFRLSQAILDVSGEDVQRVAKAYLVDSTRTVATLVRPESP